MITYEVKPRQTVTLGECNGIYLMHLGISYPKLRISQYLKYHKKFKSGPRHPISFSTAKHHPHPFWRERREGSFILVLILHFKIYLFYYTTQYIPRAVIF